MKFKKLRKFISPGDAISIVLLSTEDDDATFLNEEFVPKRYNKCKVIGFSNSKIVITANNKRIMVNGIEIYLDDTKIKGGK